LTLVLAALRSNSLKVEAWEKRQQEKRRAAKKHA